MQPNPEDDAAREHRRTRDFTETVDQEVKQFMGPHVNAMRKDFMQKWSHLDPEITLIHMLCEKHGLEAPDVSMLRKSRPKANAAKYQKEEATASEVAATGVASGQGIDMDASASMPPRPESNLSNYKGNGADYRPESAASTRFADTPLEPTGRNTATPTARPMSGRRGRPGSARRGATSPALSNVDDETLSGADLDNLRVDDGAYVRDVKKKAENALALVGQNRFGHFVEFPLPETQIDDCEKTPMIIRRSACLRDRLDERRQDNCAALGKVGLKSLDRVLANSENDFQKYRDRDVCSTTGFGTGFTNTGFAARIATLRQGMRSEFLSGVALLSSEVLSNEDQSTLVGKLAQVNLAMGESVFTEGEVADKLYIVESGSCLVTKVIEGEKRVLTDIKQGDSFGDLAVMYAMTRAATVTAATAVKLLALSREDIFSSVSPASIEKMKAMTKMQLTQATPALATQSKAVKVRLLENMRSDVFPAGREIMREGWKSDSRTRRVYIIEKGSCSVVRKAEPASVQELFPGQNFGSTELTFGCPQQSTVIAKTELTVISISYDEMKAVLGDEADAALQLMRRTMHLSLLREAHPNLKTQSDQALKSVLDASTLRQFKAWQPVIKKDEIVTHLVMLDEGTCLQQNDHGQAMDFTDAQAACNGEEHSRPGLTFLTGVAVANVGTRAPYTLVTEGQSSFLFVPMDVLRSLPNCRKGKSRHRGSVNT